LQTALLTSLDDVVFVARRLLVHGPASNTTSRVRVFKISDMDILDERWNGVLSSSNNVRRTFS